MMKSILAAIAVLFLNVTHAQNTVTVATQKTDADYFLAVVTATIKTGRDNKEYPSSIQIRICCGNEPITGVNHGFSIWGYTTELPKNNSRSLIIPQLNRYDAKTNSLAAYKQYGLKFTLDYFANIVLDAWKIESISLTLEFKDAGGKPHPTMGRRTITFGDSDVWMDGFDKATTYYKTDKYFNALPVKQYAANKLSNTRE